MSRLDQHVASVRVRIAASTFLRAVAWTVLVYASLVFLGVLLHRFGPFAIPVPRAWLWGGVGIAVALALGYTAKRWPSKHDAAVAIDRAMGLDEKFSTALFARASKDPFAMAAVRDAEETASRVNVRNTSPIRAPWLLGGTPGIVMLILVLMFWAGPRPPAVADINTQTPKRVDPKAAQDAKRLLDQAMSAIAAMPETASNDTQVKQAATEIKSLLQKPIRDPEAVRQTALSRMAEMESIKQKIKETAAVARAENDMKAFKSMPMPSDPNSPIGKVQTAVAKGNFSQAVEDLKNVVDKFPDMKQEDQKKAADEMSKMAQQMKDLAKDTKQQDALKKQLKDMGATDKQLQDLSKAIQGAANGDKQSQEQAKQVANQIAQNINQNGGLTPQQQQQIQNQVQKAASQMQGAANNQAAAQQMAGAAQAMAQAMQQAAQGQQTAQAKGNASGGNQQQQGQKPGQGQQQANAGQKSGAGQQPGQAPGQAQQPGQGQQPGQSGQQPGDQPGQGPGQGEANAQEQMKQQLQQMQQAADDAAAIAQGKMAGGEADGGDQPGGQVGQGGQFRQGPMPKPGPGGGGGAAIAAGGARPKGEEAAFGVKQEQSPTHTDPNGKLLASTFIKSTSEAGKSKVGLSEAIEAEQKDAADEVDQDRISRQAAGAVKRYFDEVKHGAEDK